MEEFENNNVIEETEAVGSTETVEPKEGIDLGGYAILGLAGVGGAFLIKKAYDLGKKGFNKAKAAIAAHKEKKAAAASNVASEESKDTSVAPEEKSEQ